ncbi:16211_t:CDS:2 [Dentiscutata erythropus]|uniref:16211_t:CDS:1 n=1 Tax=Dentiscutata erythropus TaxID=1348616 RepID=A0A9N8VBS0_9GLOM|nr:16211_t:CDS:2 [Dentiscutata erythropus]
MSEGIFEKKFAKIFNKFHEVQNHCLDFRKNSILEMLNLASLIYNASVDYKLQYAQNVEIIKKWENKSRKENNSDDDNSQSTPEQELDYWMNQQIKCAESFSEKAELISKNFKDFKTLMEYDLEKILKPFWNKRSVDLELRRSITTQYKSEGELGKNKRKQNMKMIRQGEIIADAFQYRLNKTEIKMTLKEEIETWIKAIEPAIESVDKISESLNNVHNIEHLIKSAGLDDAMKRWSEVGNVGGLYREL